MSVGGHNRVTHPVQSVRVFRAGFLCASRCFHARAPAFQRNKWNQNAAKIEQ